jgi:hypothetical protein
LQSRELICRKRPNLICREDQIVSSSQTVELGRCQHSDIRCTHSQKRRGHEIFSYEALYLKDIGQPSKSTNGLPVSSNYRQDFLKIERLVRAISHFLDYRQVANLSKQENASEKCTILVQKQFIINPSVADSGKSGTFR